MKKSLLLLLCCIPSLMNAQRHYFHRINGVDVHFTMFVYGEVTFPTLFNSTMVANAKKKSLTMNFSDSALAAEAKKNSYSEIMDMVFTSAGELKRGEYAMKCAKLPNPQTGIFDFRSAGPYSFYSSYTTTNSYSSGMGISNTGSGTPQFNTNYTTSSITQTFLERTDQGKRLLDHRSWQPTMNGGTASMKDTAGTPDSFTHYYYTGNSRIADSIVSKHTAMGDQVTSVIKNRIIFQTADSVGYEYISRFQFGEKLYVDTVNTKEYYNKAGAKTLRVMSSREKEYARETWTYDAAGELISYSTKDKATSYNYSISRTADELPLQMIVTSNDRNGKDRLVIDFEWK
jgi:hypothetical protein